MRSCAETQLQPAGESLAALARLDKAGKGDNDNGPWEKEEDARQQAGAR